MVLFRKGQRWSTWINGSLSLSTILYMCQPHATQFAKVPLCAFLLQSLIRASFWLLCISNLVAVCRWTSQLLLRGSFSKRSTGRRVTGSLSLSTILYMIADDARLTPPCCKKHTFAALHLNGLCTWTSQLLSTGSFSRQVNGSLSLSLYYIW